MGCLRRGKVYSTMLRPSAVPVQAATYLIHVSPFKAKCCQLVLPSKPDRISYVFILVVSEATMIAIDWHLLLDKRCQSRDVQHVWCDVTDCIGA